MIEDALAGPLPDAVVRGAFADSVQRRIAAELDDEAVVVVIERVVDTNAFKVALERTLTSPAIRAALSQQSVTFADELAAQARRRLARLDSLVGRFVVAAPAAYAGIVSRSAAFVADLVFAQLVFLVGAGVVALIGSLIGGYVWQLLFPAQDLGRFGSFVVGLVCAVVLVALIKLIAGRRGQVVSP